MSPEDKERLVRLLKGLIVNEMKRPDASGFINPSEERLAGVNEVAWALDQLFDLGNGDPVAGAQLWSSFRPLEANMALVEALKKS